jgi:hypothetical protein
MPTTGGIGSPLLFAIVVGWIGIAIAVFWSMLFQGMWIPFMGGGEEAAIMAGFTAAWAVGLIILAPVFVIIGVFIGAAILHLMLMIVGGANNGFEATVRVVCYAQTAQLASIIPICGGLVSLVWAIILYVFGLAAAHRTTQGKAALAVALPVVLCCASFGPRSAADLVGHRSPPPAVRFPLPHRISMPNLRHDAGGDRLPPWGSRHGLHRQPTRRCGGSLFCLRHAAGGSLDGRQVACS